MQLSILPTPQGPLVKVHSTGVLVKELQDALDLMAECTALDARGMILEQHQLIPEFFELRTGLAGEVLQKFSTYRMKLAIVGNFAGITSNSLQDFIRESNRYGQVCFVSSEEEAVVILGRV
jgi:hypothetical protein